MSADRRTLSSKQFSLLAMLLALTAAACAMSTVQWFGAKALPYVLASFGALLGFLLGASHSRLATINPAQRVGQSMAFAALGFVIGKAGDPMTRSPNSAPIFAAIYAAIALSGMLGLGIGVVIRRRVAARRGLPSGDSAANEQGKASL